MSYEIESDYEISSGEDDDQTVNYEVLAECRNNISKRNKSLSLIIHFKNQFHFNIISEAGYDLIYGEISRAIKKKYGREWTLDNLVETVCQIKDIYDLDVSENDWMLK